MAPSARRCRASACCVGLSFGGTTQHGDAFTASEYAAMARDAGLQAGPPLPLPPTQERLIELVV